MGTISFWEEAEIDGPRGHFILSGRTFYFKWGPFILGRGRNRRSGGTIYFKIYGPGDILFQNILSGGTVLGGTKFFVTDLCKAHNTGKIKIFRKCKIIIIK